MNKKCIGFSEMTGAIAERLLCCRPKCLLRKYKMFRITGLVWSHTIRICWEHAIWQLSSERWYWGLEKSQSRKPRRLLTEQLRNWVPHNIYWLLMQPTKYCLSFIGGNSSRVDVVNLKGCIAYLKFTVGIFIDKTLLQYWKKSYKILWTRRFIEASLHWNSLL